MYMQVIKILCKLQTYVHVHACAPVYLYTHATVGIKYSSIEKQLLYKQVHEHVIEADAYLHDFVYFLSFTLEVRESGGKMINGTSIHMLHNNSHWSKLSVRPNRYPLANTHT